MLDILVNTMKTNHALPETLFYFKLNFASWQLYYRVGNCKRRYLRIQADLAQTIGFLLLLKYGEESQYELITATSRAIVHYVGQVVNANILK